MKTDPHVLLIAQSSDNQCFPLDFIRSPTLAMSFTYLLMPDSYYYLENIEYLIEVKVLTSYVELMDFLTLSCVLFEKIAAKKSSMWSFPPKILHVLQSILFGYPWLELIRNPKKMN